MDSIFTPAQFQERFEVSSETLQKLQVYADLLEKWQKTINLVSRYTLQELWSRHFADSAQLMRFIPSGTQILYDLGSGAGFPGLVLGLMRPDLKVSLIESDQRKAQFLKTVSRETSSGVNVLNQRIEMCEDMAVPDVITARALARISVLLELTKGWWSRNPNLAFCFLKGETAYKEIQEALSDYNFSHETHKSITNEDASVVLITHVSIKQIS